MILVIIGPSGSGKAALASALGAEGVLHPHSTWTDRVARPDDAASMEHTFITRAKFTELLEEGFFLGTAELFTHRYGLPPWPEQRRGVLAVILRANLVDQFVAATGLEKVVVYQVTAPRDSVADALSQRSLSSVDLEIRLAEHDAETALGSMIADRIFVNDGSFQHLVDRVRAAVLEDAGGFIDLSSNANPTTVDVTEAQAALPLVSETESVA